jgi:tRNA pseudouridine55 synthase
MSRRKKGDDVSGWVVLDKPDDMTSTHAVSAVRRIFNAQKPSAVTSIRQAR